MQTTFKALNLYTETEVALEWGFLRKSAPPKLQSNIALDGPAIRNANRGKQIDSQKIPYFHNVRATRANRLKPAIRNYLWPPKRDSPKRGSVREPWNDS